MAILKVLHGRHRELEECLGLAVRALRQVSFYAKLGHGDKSRDYGEVVDPVLKSLGEPTGQI